MHAVDNSFDEEPSKCRVLAGAECAAADSNSLITEVVVFLTAYLGTIAAGALFGTLLGGIAGFVFGTIYAGIVGLPIFITIAAITHLLWLSKYCVLMAALGGAWTGVTATAMIWSPMVFDAPFLGVATIAGILGGVGGVVGSALIVAKNENQERLRSQPIVKSSVIEKLLRVVSAFGLVAVWSWIALSVYHARMPITVEDLTQRFEVHEPDFKQIASMFEADEKFNSIYSDGSFDDKIISRERGAQYLALLRNAELSGSTVHAFRNDSNLQIEIIPKKGFRDDCIMKYLYSTHEPEHIVARFDESDFEKLGLGKSANVRIGHNWYVLIEKPDYPVD